MIQYDKEEITKRILEEMPDSIAKESYLTLPLDKIIFQWWATGRSGKSLRLSLEGNIAFSYAGIQKYDVECLVPKDENPQKFINMLSNKLRCPFAITNKKNNSAGTLFTISLYDSKIAMMVMLYGGLYEYLTRTLYEE
jgi:hypothetical protein